MSFTQRLRKKRNDAFLSEQWNDFSNKGIPEVFCLILPPGSGSMTLFVAKIILSKFRLSTFLQIFFATDYLLRPSKKIIKGERS